MVRLSGRTDYKLTNSNYNIRLNPYKVTTSIKILIWCSCVSEDTKWVLPLSQSDICYSKHAFFQSVTWLLDKCWLAATVTLFNWSFWLVRKHNSNTLFKWHLLKYHFGFDSLHWIVSRQITGAGKVEIRQWSYFHIAVIFK